jgi:hypothetical protein
MPPHVYDSYAIRILPAALGAAMRGVNSPPSRPLGKDEIAKLSKRITNNLLAAFDLGEREPTALRRAAIEGIEKSD